jgi:hypothetical protein
VERTDKAADDEICAWRRRRAVRRTHRHKNLEAREEPPV